MNPNPKLVYSPKYDVSFLCLDMLHPFDGCKYSRAWETLKERFKLLDSVTVFVNKPATEEELKSIHSSEYLKSLHSDMFRSSNIIQALELPSLLVLPGQFFDQIVLIPMRYAVSGTIQAAYEALEHGISINLSGGYHHAGKSHGEGFCLYSDIAIAIKMLRFYGKLKHEDRSLIIDLDAHQGNGLERIFREDKTVYFFDMYNKDIYPIDEDIKKRINFNIPLTSGTDGSKYLQILKEKLPNAIKQIKDEGEIKIAFYNAGTDVYEDDPLGSLKVSETHLLERDKFVSRTLTEFGIPWVMLLGGGYTKKSYRFIVESVSWILKTYGGIENVW